MWLAVHLHHTAALLCKALQARQDQDGRLPRRCCCESIDTHAYQLRSSGEIQPRGKFQKYSDHNDNKNVFVILWHYVQDGKYTGTTCRSL